ncbi:LytR family transcriptional attenuator [Sediminihabitans luteus]|uniref:LytR family transcriptional attenuator n=1 Tax=Sediminihabitans luteus TaxID=1138585 RepID=A0A2M9CE60_9CELL|nr:LCP family protein [Sediminihabitans luteus]PJJ70152.1 LytR family transcriptional attenuator [Sediminihabitans luteus]GII97623.1 hypothetical protein Slu03_00010 [Sediminihabitans luteus]
MPNDADVFAALQPEDDPTAGTSGTGSARHRTRNTLIVLVVILAVVAGGAFGAVKWFQHSLDNNIEHLADPFADLPDDARPAPAPSDDAADTTAVNILVLGSDSRISAGDPSQWEAGAQRTDSIMLVHVPVDRESAQVVSIPRDLWVPIPGHGEAKINAAFSYGGPSLMIETVEDLTGVRIDHFVVTDFESFTTLTDELGGVSIRVADGAPDGQGGTYAGGIVDMDGEQVLAYARDRHDLANGDFGRVQRQQAWLRSIVAKVNNNRNDVLMMKGFFEAVSKSVAADEGFTIDEMTKLYQSGRDISTTDVTFMTVPHSGTGRSADGQSIVVVNHAAMDPLMASIANDTSAQYVEDHATELDVLPPTAP